MAFQPGVAHRRATSSPRAEVVVKARQPDSAARPTGQALWGVRVCPERKEGPM